MKKITKNLLSLALLLTIFGLPLLVGAQFDPTRGSGSLDLSTDSLYDTIVRILEILLVIIVLVAVLGFIISGFMFITAGGNSERAESAKNWLVYSIIGIAVALIGYIAIGFVAQLLNAG